MASEPDFTVFHGEQYIWVSDADDRHVAKFEPSKHGLWAFDCFMTGAKAKNMIVIEENKGESE